MYYDLRIKKYFCLLNNVIYIQIIMVYNLNSLRFLVVEMFTCSPSSTIIFAVESHEGFHVFSECFQLFLRKNYKS